MTIPAARDMGQDITNLYRRHVRRKALIVCGLAALLVVACVMSLRIGSYRVAYTDLLHALIGSHADEALRHVLLNIRMPRMLAAVLAGGCLGLAGLAMQTVLRNPLASPFTLGVSQGAAFGAALAIMLPTSLPNPFAIGGMAFLGSLVTVLVLLLLSAWRELSPPALILAGVALSSFFSAATMLLQYFAADIDVAAAIFWTFGDLGRAGWRELAVIGGVLVPAAVFFLLRRWQFDALLWGDDSAKSLGVDVQRMRLTSLIVAALVAAVTTAFLGIIGFVGLIAPHIVRMALGHNHRFLFPCSLFAGGLLLLVSDALARTVLAPVILPVGILTSFAGAPLFLYLLMRRRGIGT